MHKHLNTGEWYRVTSMARKVGMTPDLFMAAATMHLLADLESLDLLAPLEDEIGATLSGLDDPEKLGPQAWGDDDWRLTAALYALDERRSYWQEDDAA